MTAQSSIEVDTGPGSQRLGAMTFTADGKCLVGSDWEKVRIWRVEDGAQVATMETGRVFCLAVSKNGRWLAAGTLSGEVVVWNTAAYEKVLAFREDGEIHAVDFSPSDSTRLLVAPRSGTAAVLELTSRKQVQRLPHTDHVVAAKYSFNGDLIATATENSVRVWDGNDGGLLVEVQVQVLPLFNTGLVWFQNSHILVVSNGRIHQIHASTGSIASEWPAPHADCFSSIFLPRHREFIIGATSHAVTFWDSSTHSQLALASHHPRGISAIALSPDDRFLAICGDGEKLSIQSLLHISDSAPLSRLQCTFQELDIQLHDITLDPCEHDHLAKEDALLTTAIHKALNLSNHVFASRALIRVRLKEWKAALIDAEKAIDVRPSVMGYVAKSVAHVGMGEMHEAYDACDIAFELFHSLHGGFLLLIKSIIMSMADEHRHAISNIDSLIAADPTNSIYYIVQAYILLLLGNSLMEKGDYGDAVQSFQRARAQMRHHTKQSLSVVSLISGWKFETLGIAIRQRLCEALYAVGRIGDAGESLLEMVTTFDREVDSDPIINWVFDFVQKSLSIPENEGDAALSATQHGAHANPMPLLREWIKAALTIGEWKDALFTATNFRIPRATVYQATCVHLEVSERITDAVECFHQMTNELGPDTQNELQQWVHWFSRSSLEKLANLGDTAADAQRYDEAISYYTTALSLNPSSPEGILIKRCKAFAITGSWKQALDDVNLVIALDASLPWSYEMKHAVLHELGDYDDAVCAFETMLEKMEESLDPDIRGRRYQYKTPAEIKSRIRRIVKQTIRNSPHILINTITGQLYDRDERVHLFESTPLFHELVSSMTTSLDLARIKREVREYFQYVVLSHHWEDNEPLFDHVVQVAVYDLSQSPTHDKLQMFCKIVQAAGFNWAWSDTCCINTSNHFVLQESLVAMFKWYKGSAMMIVFLRGVSSSSPPGALANSVWNTRAWTLQEYIAAKNIRFYTEDWTLYRDLELLNHKESSEIISEMEEATKVPARQLMTLRPGLTSIREKLRLASTRKTTRVEDAAYSMLGIFSAVGIPPIYGEGEVSLGRLLANILTRSGDVSILAWTGESSRFNSCLPARITVFKQLEASHLPLPIPAAEMERIMCHFPLDIDAALRLYDHLGKLSTPRFAESRMTLPCIAFQIPSLSLVRASPNRVFRVDTDTFGTVEIKTKYDIARMGPLYLVHPWLDTLLEREAKRGSTFFDDQVVSPSQTMDADEDTGEESDKISGEENGEDEVDEANDDESDDNEDSEYEYPSYYPSVHAVSMDKETRARRLVALLRQPFGALLLRSTGLRTGDYRRVATDSLITVRFLEDVSLDDILDHAHPLDIL